MQKSILFILLSIFLSFNTFSQLPDGSIAPDFTGTDINGNEVNLYSLLDQGYSVILDFSTTWCPPCWQYHTGGALEELWEDHGPDGTNDVYVIFVESWGTTTLEDLQGIGDNTQGNWIEGTEYPIIDDVSIGNLYEVSYYPTIYTVCPNRFLRETKRKSAEVHYELIDECLIPSGNNNAGILAYETYDSTFCGELAIEPSMVLQNQGNQELSSATVELSVDGNLIQSIDWVGSLNTYYFENIVFDEIVVSENALLEMSIVSVNGDEDEVDDEFNSITSSLIVTDMVVPTTNITVEVRTDAFGSETYWEILDEDGGIVIWGGNEEACAGCGNYSIEGGYDGATLYTEEIELPVGCYTFRIIDEVGDGLWGGAYYAVYGDDEAFIYGEGSFSIDWEEYTKAFRIEFNSGVKDVATLSKMELFPNPASTDLYMNLSLTDYTKLNCSITNVMGSIVSERNIEFNSGEHQIRFNIDDLAEGLYFLSLNDGTGISTQRFSIAK